GTPGAVGQTQVFNGRRTELGISPEAGGINDVIGKIDVVGVGSVLPVLQHSQGHGGLFQINILAKLGQGSQIIPMTEILRYPYPEAIAVEWRGKPERRIVSHKSRLDVE